MRVFTPKLTPAMHCSAGSAGCAAQPVKGLRQSCDGIQNSSASEAPGLLTLEQAWSNAGQLQSKRGGHHSLSEGAGPETKLHAGMDKHGHQSGTAAKVVALLPSMFSIVVFHCIISYLSCSVATVIF